MNLETIDGLLALACRRHAAAPAVGDDDATITYSELLDEAARLANGLQAAGAGPGRRVVVLTADRVEGVVAYLAVWLTGATVVHASARLAAPEIAHIITDSDAFGVLHTADLADPFAATGLSGAIDLTVELDRAAGSAYRDLLARASATPPAQVWAGASTAVIAYTSGTTGRPKGAVVSHRALAMQTRVGALNYGVSNQGRMAYSASLSFIGSVWGQLLPHLYTGSFVRMLGSFTIESWFAAMRRDRSTFTYVATPLMVDFAAEVERDRSILDHLHTVFHAGSLAPESHVERLVAALDGRYVESYGSTELVGSATATAHWMYRDPQAPTRLYASGGLVVPHAEMWIELPDGSRAETGEVGEIVVRSDTMFDGYWHDPEKTAATLVDGAFHMGDAGCVDEQGYLYVSGRRSDLIVSGGANVYPAEVERVILGLHGVAQVAVFGAPHERWGETVIAAVVVEPGSVITAGEVVDHCRSQLASYKKPTAVVFLPELPQTAVRKVDTRALRASYLDGAHSSVAT